MDAKGVQTFTMEHGRKVRVGLTKDKAILFRRQFCVLMGMALFALRKKKTLLWGWGGGAGEGSLSVILF